MTLQRQSTIIILFLMTAFLSTDTWAQARKMQVDDKVVARILGLSETGRTLLLNRGEEHGVQVGLHARFSTPQDGYFARAVVIRSSPSRSVWSVYRIPKSGVLRENLVATVKIATPATVTDDETRSLGLLASDYDRRVNETIPQEQEDRPRGATPQSRLTDHLVELPDEETRRIHQGRDFSGLTSPPGYQRDNRVDWSALDEGVAGRGERGQRDNVDYSNLDGHRR